jgi:putative addiction module killer protein
LGQDPPLGGAWEAAVYFGRDGETLVILLTGGTKQRQQRDIERAKELWADYKRRRKPPAR